MSTTAGELPDGNSKLGIKKYVVPPSSPLKTAGKADFNSSI
jgi:hypothetical protein